MSDSTDAEAEPGERLLFECMELYAGGGEAAVEKCLLAHPEHATRVRGELALLRRTGLLGIHGASDGLGQADFPERLGEFRLLERLGSGGMGVVYRAVQEPLSREVALKLIRPEHLYFPGSRERFQREVLAIARLQHPGIVPVHMVGEENGIPFFAMELIDGCTLADVLARLRGRDPATLRARDMRQDSAARSDDGRGWVEACLVFVRDIAEALDHAHGRGVLHRDIKPSNIAVTRAGRGLVFDFGLASIGDSERITRSGSQPGSLPYMSREQVLGLAHIDARTDVYSLGVVLYEMLTLRAAFEATQATVDTLRAKIAAGDFVRPRALHPTLARDVEIVCMKALAAERERRYDSASDFARDLGNLLRHRPIEARVPAPWLRALRWSQRNPALSGSLAVALVLVVCASAVVLRQQVVHGRELEAKSDIARIRLEDTHRAANALLFEVNGAIKDLAGSTPAHEMIVRRALDMLEKLSAAAVGDSALQSDLAWAHVQLGDVLGGGVGASLGDSTLAREQYAIALAIYAELLAADPTSHRDRVRGATAQLQLGVLDEFAGRADDALVSYGLAITAARALVAENPLDLGARQLLGAALHNQAGSLSVLGRFDAALEAGNEALAVLSKNVADGPERPVNQLNLMGIHKTLNRVHLARGELERAEHELDCALEIADRLAREDPSNGRVRAAALEIRWLRAKRLISPTSDQGLRLMLSLRDQLEALRAADPRNVALTRFAVGAHQTVGFARIALGDTEHGVEDLEHSLALARELQGAGWDARVEWDVCADLRYLSQAKSMLGAATESLALCAELEATQELYFARSHDTELVQSGAEMLAWAQSQIADAADSNEELDAVAAAVQKLCAGNEFASSDQASQIARAAAELFVARVAFAVGDDQRTHKALADALSLLTALRESGAAENTVGALGIHALTLLAAWSAKSGDSAAAITACERVFEWSPAVWNGDRGDARVEARLRIALPAAIRAAQLAGGQGLAETLAKRLMR